MTRAAAGASPARSGLAPSGCTCQKLRISVKRTRCADFCGNPSRTKGKLKILKKAEKERRRQASDEEAAAAAVTDDVDLGRYAHAIRSRKAGTPDIPLENQVAAEACRQGLQAGHGLYQALSTNPQLQAQLSEVLLRELRDTYHEAPGKQSLLTASAAHLQHDAAVGVLVQPGAVLPPNGSRP